MGPFDDDVEARQLLRWRAEAAPVPPTVRARVEGTTSEPSGRGRMLEGTRILLLEDHGDTRHLYASALAQQGARVFEAGSAQVALIILQREQPDLILVDIELPDADGYTFFEAVKRLPPDGGGQIPAVVLSVRNAPADRMESLKRGFRLHLVKPIDPGELCRILGGLMKLGHD